MPIFDEDDIYADFEFFIIRFIHKLKYKDIDNLRELSILYKEYAMIENYKKNIDELCKEMHRQLHKRIDDKHNNIRFPH